MSLRDRISSRGKSKFERIAGVMGLSLLVILFMTSGSISCKKKAAETEASVAPAPVEEGSGVKEGINEIAGTVKIGYGEYFYLPSVQGFDIAVQGKIEGQDASTLVGKNVKVKALYSRAKHSLLIAESIDVEEGTEQWRNVYTKTEDIPLENYFNQQSRQDFQALKITNVNKNEEWEGKGKGKIFGRLVTAATPQGAGQEESISIVIADDKGKEVGKIIVDKITDFTTYYIKKLRLFDKFWFYLDIKETVDKKIRSKSRELFHADVIFAGLY